MSVFYRGKSKKAALPPGTLVHIGKKITEKTRITKVEFTPDSYHEHETADISACLPLKEPPTVTWLNVSGISDLKVVESLGQALRIHPLVLEDIVNTEQRPKIEDYDDYLYVVLKCIHYNNKDNLEMDQVSLILFENLVISVGEHEEEFFLQIKDRLKNAKGRIRKMGADYLAYALIDTIVDHYFVVLEKLGEKIEDLEEELVKNPTPATLRVIHELKREMIYIRKSIWPLREVVYMMERGGSELVGSAVILYLRDVYDHAVQIIDTVETFRDMLTGMLDIYLSSLSNRLNEVMKVLTIIATIFIPLTFIAGVYGMNFKHMPELEWRYGYYVIVAGMAAIGLFMLAAFKRKKWF